MTTNGEVQRMRISRDNLGTLLHLGPLSLGWSWVHCNGESSWTEAMIAAWHHPRSVTWRWHLCFAPSRRRKRPRIGGGWWAVRTHNCGGYGWLRVPLVGVISWAWQDPIWRTEEDRRRHA